MLIVSYEENRVGKPGVRLTIRCIACSDRVESVVDRGSIPRRRAGEESLELAREVALDEYLELLLDWEVEGYPDSPVPPASSL